MYYVYLGLASLPPRDSDQSICTCVYRYGTCSVRPPLMHTCNKGQVVRRAWSYLPHDAQHLTSIREAIETLRTCISRAEV